MANKRVGNFSSYPYSDTIAQIKREIAMEKVFQVLEGLKRWKIIKDFGLTDSFARDDSKGIDIIRIYPSWGGKILLQVKSKLDYYQKKSYDRQGIYCLAVSPRMERYEVEKKVSGILAGICRKKLRKKW